MITEFTTSPSIEQVNNKRRLKADKTEHVAELTYRHNDYVHGREQKKKIAIKRKRGRQTDR